jgi:hypothetical protein
MKGDKFYVKWLAQVDEIIKLLEQQVAGYKTMKIGIEQHREKERKQHGIQKPN